MAAVVQSTFALLIFYLRMQPMYLDLRLSNVQMLEKSFYCKNNIHIEPYMDSFTCCVRISARLSKLFNRFCCLKIQPSTHINRNVIM